MVTEHVIDRQVVRALLLSPEADVLLMRWVTEGSRPIWVAPGGGIEPGETPACALRRELEEELGLAVSDLGPVLCVHEHTFNWREKRYRHIETFYVLHVPRVRPRKVQDEYGLDNIRWWTVSELRSAHERIVPRSLPDTIENYLRDGRPRAPLVPEVVVD